MYPVGVLLYFCVLLVSHKNLVQPGYLILLDTGGSLYFGRVSRTSCDHYFSGVVETRERGHSTCLEGFGIL